MLAVIGEYMPDGGETTATGTRVVSGGWPAVFVITGSEVQLTPRRAVQADVGLRLAKESSTDRTSLMNPSPSSPLSV